MKINESIFKAIIAHSKKDIPIEACGYLASREGIVVKHYELYNTDQSQEHFSFDKKDQFTVLKDAQTKGLDITGVYHSHPLTPARPSAEDIKLAYDPNIEYVIVSLANDKPQVKSFSIDSGEIKEQTLEVIDG